MDVARFTVLLTDTQDIKVLEHSPTEEIFDAARDAIGCDWIELVEPESLTNDGYLMLIDEEGKLKDGPLSINCIASDLYGSDRHGDPIIGSAVIVKTDGENLFLLQKEEAQLLATKLLVNRRDSIDKMAKAFGVRPTPQHGSDIPDPTRRQSCKKSGVER